MSAPASAAVMADVGHAAVGADMLLSGLVQLRCEAPLYEVRPVEWMGEWWSMSQVRSSASGGDEKAAAAVEEKCGEEEPTHNAARGTTARGHSWCGRCWHQGLRRLQVLPPMAMRR